MWGMVAISVALKGGTWEMKGADRFIAYTLLCFAQCSETAAMASGQTVMKKPAEYTMAASSTRAQLAGSLAWEA